MHTNARRTVFDGLRIETMRNGAIKSQALQSERPIMDQSVHAAMDPGGIGAAWTTSRSSRTYTGGGITPQQYIRSQPANVDDILTDSGTVMNARAALPNRGVTPNSPLMRRS